MSWIKPHWIVTHHPDKGWFIKTVYYGNGCGGTDYYRLEDVRKMLSGAIEKPVGSNKEFRLFDINN